jgi:FkbM family methyltransferase
MLKSALLRFPAVYEWVERYRDGTYLKNAQREGSYAQHGEDLELLRHLQARGATGPFVDVGCNHPFKLSNTYLLYTKGYRGICIDPLPRYQALYQRWRPQDRFIRTAIGEVGGELAFHEFESDVLSTLDPQLASLYTQQGYRQRRQSSVRVARLDTVLEEAGLKGPISLLSIDIEGHELPALRSIDLQRWQPALICLEVATADGQRNHGALDHLMRQGYAVTLDLGLNIVLGRTQVTDAHSGQ